MSLSLPLRLLFIAAVALAVTAVDWGLKAWAVEALHPDQIVFNLSRPWHFVLVCAVIGAGLVAVARTRLLALGAAVVIGGGLGKIGELAGFGRVTDFIPLGIPFRGAVRARPTLGRDALQARDPLHGRRRRSRRERHAVP